MTDVNDAVPRRWTRWSTRASPASRCSWPTRACSSSTTGRSSARCSARARSARSSACTPRTASPSTSWCSRRSRPGTPRRSTTAHPRRGCSRPRGPHRAIAWPRWRGAPVYIVHLSAAARARAGGRGPRPRAAGLRRDLPAVPVPVRRRPGAARTSRAPSTCARRRCGPRSTRRSCGAGCATHDLQVVSTDHCPFCMKGQKDLGRGTSPRSPTGMPGVETRMDLLYQARARRAHLADALRRDRQHRAGQDLRPLPAQGHHRRRRRRRHRGLRPAAEQVHLRARRST